MCEAGCGVFRVADGDLLKILDAPEIAVLAYSTEIKASDSKGFRADLGVPAVKAPEITAPQASDSSAPSTNLVTESAGSEGPTPLKTQ